MKIKVLLKKIIFHTKELILQYKNFPYENGRKNLIYPKIASEEETLKKILKDRCSVARFGDSELTMALENKNYASFQRSSLELHEKLKKILKNNNDNLLVCLSPFFSSIKIRFLDKLFWRKFMIRNRERIYNVINLNRQYYSAQITRPYIIYNNYKYSDNIFNVWKKIFKNQNLVIVEGEGTRFGVGNSLLKEVKSIKRIICPSENAFDKYQLILTNTLKIANKNDLILIALGPTATVLASDLALLNLWAIDIGHLDVEYEWFIRKTKSKIKIKNKCVLEAGSNKVENCEDSSYLNSIVFNLV